MYDITLVLITVRLHSAFSTEAGNADCTYLRFAHFLDCNLKIAQPGVNPHFAHFIRCILRIVEAI